MQRVKGRVRTRSHIPVSRLYLDALFAAAQESRVRQFQRLLGLRTLLPVVLQPAELALVDGESLQRLLRAEIALKADRAGSCRLCSGQMDTAAPKGTGSVLESWTLVVAVLSAMLTPSDK